MTVLTGACSLGSSAGVQPASATKYPLRATPPPPKPHRTVAPGHRHVMLHTGCNNDLREVVLGDSKVGIGGVPAVLEVAEDALNQGMGPAQAPVKVSLTWNQVASVGPHQLVQKWVGRVPDEKGWDHDGAQLQVWQPWCEAPTID